MLALRATAGLRLLPGKQAEDLLNAVRGLFGKYSFHLPPNPVAIMDGLDEGKFGWIAVNYLLNRLGPAHDQFTVGTIDLGGEVFPLQLHSFDLHQLVAKFIMG